MSLSNPVPPAAESLVDGRSAEIRQSVSSSHGSCPSCGQGRPASSVGEIFVYAVGAIEPRFPTLAVEKEFAQAAGRAEAPNLKDREAAYAVLSKPENWYLARQLCWVFLIKGFDTYVVVPPGAEELRLLIQTFRPKRTSSDIDILIGMAGPPVGGRACNGLMLPAVSVAQLYSFNEQDFVAHLSRQKDVPENSFAASVSVLLRLADNPGARSDHRAINYLVTRDPSLHAAVAQRSARNLPLTGVRARSSGIIATREVLDVIFTFRQAQANVTEELCTGVDVTELFPFLTSKLGPYIER